MSADAVIRFDTKIDASGVDSGVQNIEKDVEKHLGKMKNSFEDLGSTVNKAFSGEGAEDMSATLMRQYALVDELKAKYEALANGEVAPKELAKTEKEFAALQVEIEKTRQEYLNLSREADRVSTYMELSANANKGIASPEIQEEMKKLDGQLMAIAEREGEMLDKSRALADKMQQIKLNPELTQEGQALATKLEIATVRLSEMEAKASKAGVTAPKALKDTGEAAKKANRDVSGLEKMMGKFLNRIKSAALTVMVFQLFRSAFKSLRDYIGLALKDNQAFVSSLAQLKGNLSTAFQPILQAIVPILTTLIYWLSIATQYLATFISMLFGKSVKASQDAAKNMDKLAESTKKAGGASKDANKEAKKMLATFDEVNKRDGETSGGGSDAGGIAPVYEELPEPDFSIWEKFLEILQPTIDALKRLGDELWRVKDFAWQGLLDFYNKFLVPVGKWILGTGLPRLIDGLTRMVKEIDWKRLNEALAAFWEALAKFSITIGEGLLYFYENVLVPVGIWFANNVLPVAIDLITGAINGLNSVFEILGAILDPIFQNIIKPLGEFLAAIFEPVLRGMSVGAKNVSEVFNALATIVKDNKDKLDAFLNPVKEWIEKATDWIKNNETLNGILEFFGEVLGTLITTIGIIIAVKTAWSIITGALTLATGALGTAISILTSSITLVVAAIAGIITVIVLLIQHWDAVSAAASWALEGMMSVWGNIAAWFTEKVIDPIKNGFKEAINFLIGLFEGFANGFISAINFIIDAMNRVSFEIPDWVPGGPATFGFNIPRVANVQIPRLATGAVIPPNKEFLAVLGDQKHGTNIEAPLSTIEDAVRNVLAEMGFDVNVFFKGEGGLVELVRILMPHIEVEQRKTGTRFAGRAVFT